MIRIGDFARLGQVSVVTLRHYDEIGLLVPAVVDEETGYRHYEVAQLARLNRILALKELGFSLSQCRDVLEGLTIERLRGMLLMRQAEAEQAIERERERLLRITARLKQIEEEERMPEYDVIVKTAPAALIASRKVTIPTNDQVPKYLGGAFDETYRHVARMGAKEAAPCMAIWHQGAEVLVGEVAEAAVPIDQPIAPSEDVAVYELPATVVASVIHQGAYEGFPQAHAVLLSWIESNKYRALGTYREVYIHAGKTPSENMTEVQYPVEKAD